MQDVTSLMMMQGGVYVSGELWDFWCDTFPRPSICEMWAFVMNDIDDERAKFVRSLDWRGPRSPILDLSFDFIVCKAFTLL